jgi:molybdenum cofactor cytidylyltransferase
MRAMPAIAIVPAAGSGTRFGAPLKLLAPVDGVPMLERTLRALLAADVAAVIVVVAPDVELPGIGSLNDSRVRTVVNRDPARGMFSSIQIGAAAASDTGPVVIHPADMPFVSSRTVDAVVASCRDTGHIVAASFRGKRGHPVAMPATLLPQIGIAPATATLSAVLDRAPEGRTTLDVDDPGVLRDVDVPADL